MTKPPEQRTSDALRFQPVNDPRLTLRRQVFDISATVDADEECFEIHFYEGVLAEDPCNEDALMLLGHAYTHRGEFQRGLEVDERLTRLRPNDPTAFYNLACSFALVDRIDDAFAALQKAFALGYRDLAHLMKDPDLESLRKDRRFRAFVGRCLTRNPRNS